MTTRSKLIATTLGLAAALAGAACTKNARGETSPPPAVPVVVALVGTQDMPLEIRAVGSVEPLASASIRPQVTGQILSAHFREGADVREGDLLFSIDPRPFQAALAQAEASLARDRAQAKNAEAEAKRGGDLFGQGILSKEGNDQLAATAEALVAAARADEAAAQNARLSLEYCAIRAPFAGRTGAILVKPGNVVKAVDGGPLVVVNQIDPIYVVFAVPEARLAEVTTAAAAGRAKVIAAPAGEEARPLTGELAFLDNEVDRGSGTVRLRGRFANRERRLWPGQFVTARLMLDVRKGALVVPAQAVLDGQAGRYVFLMKPDHTVEVRAVEVGPAVEGNIVVEKGLAAGDMVVTDGQVRLVPGARVEPKAGAKGAAS